MSTIGKTALVAEGISKRYVIGHQHDSRDALRHRMEDALRHPVRWLRRRHEEFQATREEFWALNDVSFEIKQGDTVGIIGRNGAGKSTLLKILSRITEPTAGRLRIRGRVASLLEVGTGFHQELTGRENIFLNGAILGMTRSDIRRRFDEIVAFAEVERFLDTPVKRYSSGMYVRLAFAVAAHLEPDILVVDEVLAVGDAAFQRKCLGKMGQAATHGRTVLFVSHNMPAVQTLCKNALCLTSGRVTDAGPVDSTVGRYLTEVDVTNARRPGATVSLSNDLELLDFSFAPGTVCSGDSVRFRLQVRATRPVTLFDLSPLIHTSYGTRVAILDLRRLGFPISLAAGELWGVEGEIRTLPFVEGDYNAGLYINAGQVIENVLDLTRLTLRAKPLHSDIAPYPLMYRGFVELDFTTQRLNRGA